MNNTKLNRRNMIFSAAAAIGGASIAGKAIAQGICSITPTQPEGPFYPIDQQLDTDNDLTLVKNKGTRATGMVIYVRGVVTDQTCQPVPQALVEIWQACHTGKYNHRNDPNPAPLDPHFQYFGKAVTDAQGRYMFKTILPGAYPASNTWMRPPHIHFKIQKRGYQELITQMYFKGNSLNNGDLILKELPIGERNKVIVELKVPEAGYDPKSGVGTFNINLRRII